MENKRNNLYNEHKWNILMHSHRDIVWLYRVAMSQLMYLCVLFCWLFLFRLCFKEKVKFKCCTPKMNDNNSEQIHVQYETKNKHKHNTKSRVEMRWRKRVIKVKWFYTKKNCIHFTNCTVYNLNEIVTEI